MIGDERKTKSDLLKELNSLRSRIAQLEKAGCELGTKEGIQSEYTIKTILDDSVDGVVLVDVDTKEFYMANDVFCRMLDYSPEEIKKLGVTDVHPKEQLSYILDGFAKESGGEPSLARDIQVKRREGNIFYADVVCFPVKWKNKRCLMGIFRDVTDRRETESELLQSQFKYKILLENIPQKIFLKDKDSVYISCNENLARDLKIGSEDIVGKTDYDFFPRELAEKYRADDKRVMDSGETEEIVEKYLEQGKETFVQTVKKPVRDKQGNVVGVLGIFWDITEQKKMKEALKQSEETFRLVMEATNDALWDWNIVTNEVYRNPRHATMLGYEPHELSASREEWEKRIHPDDKHLVFKALDEHVKDGKKGSFELEYRLETKSGDYIWVLGRGKVVRYSDDGSALRMVGTNIDITERKKTEQALKESEERYRSVVEDSPVLLCSFLPDGEITFVNTAYCEYFDKTSEELVGNNFKFLIPEDDRQAVTENIMSLTVDSLLMTLEHRVTAPDGQVRWQRWTNRAIFDDQSHAVSFQSFGEDITDRKKAEQALKESEEHYRMLAETMNDGLSQVDENGMLVYVNSKCAEMLGYSQGEMIGKHWMEFYGEDSREIMTEQLLLRRKGIAEPYEIRNTRKDGRKFHIYLSPQPIFNKDGQFRGSFAIMTDITRIKEMEEELFKEKNRLQSILEVMENGVTIRDLDYTVIYQNEYITRYVGNHIGEKCYAAYEGKDRICDGCPVELAYKDGKSHSAERKVVLPSGEMTYWENIANPMRDANGNIIACLEVNTNVTKRKKAIDALGESEEKYRTLVESAGETIATIDENGVFLFMNRTAARRLAVDPEDYSGKTVWDLFPKKYADSRVAHVRKVIKTGQGMNLISATEVQGKQRWYNTTVEPLRDASGKVMAAMVLARDVTEFKQAQQELDRYREEMARTEQLASLGTLSATAAHELTQPLTVIRLLIENALTKLETTSSPETIAEKLKDSLTEISNITSVVDRLRSFARKSSGKISKEVDLKTIASRIVNLLNESAQRSSFSLHLEGMEKLPHIYSNDKDMEQLFFSLVDNAMQEGQDKENRQLVISGEEKDDHIELRFCDNCGGIASENLERLFEPFFTTKPAGQGTGLGLCIVQDIVSRAGGKIRVESEFGKGSTFFVTLPINKDER